MKLNELKPTKTTLKISTIKKKLTVNPLTLNDEVWLSERYTEEELQQIFLEINIKEISRIVFRLLDNESKKAFKAQDVDIILEDGSVVTKNLGGVELLRNACVGWDDKLALIEALNVAIGNSRPKAVESKKKVMNKKMMTGRVGQIFLIFLALSMVGTLIKFLL